MAGNRDLVSKSES